MPRVLIPSDNRDFARYLAAAYGRAGWEAAVGVGNYDLGTAAFDLVHLQWPEELSGWAPPSDIALRQIVEQLEQWVNATKVVMTVHNLEPHRAGGHPKNQRLYAAFYERVPAFAHFTEISREVAIRQYPACAGAKHIVTGFFNMDHLVPPKRDPGSARRALAVRENEFVLLVIGGLREWGEVELLRAAFDRAEVPHKRLLMCARYDEAGSRWQQRWRRWLLSRWLGRRSAIVHQGFIPDAELHRFVDASDAVIIPRFRSLNSGVPALAASFGKTIIAPNCGAYPELLTGTQNPIYAAGDAESLAHQIEAASRLDRTAVATENTHLARTWSWDEMVRRVLSAV